MRTSLIETSIYTQFIIIFTVKVKLKVSPSEQEGRRLCPAIAGGYLTVVCLGHVDCVGGSCSFDLREARSRRWKWVRAAALCSWVQKPSPLTDGHSGCAQPVTWEMRENGCSTANASEREAEKHKLTTCISSFSADDKNVMRVLSPSAGGSFLMRREKSTVSLCQWLPRITPFPPGNTFPLYDLILHLVQS